MARRFPFNLVAAYWRLTRGATLGAQAAVLDADGRVLLVRHTYQRGWHFPGGGVEWRETAEMAMKREAFEEAGIRVKGKPGFHGLFANFAWLPSDHIALFIVRDWERPAIPAPNREIVESRFFARSELPGDATGGVQRRLKEIFDGVEKQPHW